MTVRTLYGNRFPGGKLEYEVPDKYGPIPCKACKRYHAEDEAHITSPSDWNVEMANLMPYRSPGFELSAFTQYLDELARELPWNDAVAYAFHTRDPLLQWVWLEPPGVDRFEDRTLYLAAPGTEVSLKAGVVMRVTAERTGKVESPYLIHQDHEPIVLLGCTGVWAEVSRKHNAQTLAQFKEQGAKVAAKLERQTKAKIIQKVKEESAA